MVFAPCPLPLCACESERAKNADVIRPSFPAKDGGRMLHAAINGPPNYRRVCEREELRPDLRFLIDDSLSLSLS